MNIAFAALLVVGWPAFADDGAPSASQDGPPVSAMATQAPASTQPANQQQDDFLSHWFARVRAAQASQPHWMTPVATVTPRLEEEFRYDNYWEHQGTGANIEVLDAGKGLELIPTETNEVLINLPPYEERSVKNPVSGWGDWPFLTVKQRLLSANEDNGNYIVTAFLGLQAPTGDPAFTNHAWVVTPTIAAGKGWGDFDIQGTVSLALPMSHESMIGKTIVTNVTFQYHFAKFWPEIELNDTYWTDGPRGSLNQLFLTPGLILGRFDFGPHARFIIGVGYQFAVSPHFRTVPAVTPIYKNNWILTTRLAF